MTHENVEVPLPEYIREAATLAARTVIKEHVQTCPVNELVERVDKLEGRFNVLVGAILGSGCLGGGVGAVVMRLMG